MEKVVVKITCWVIINTADWLKDRHGATAIEYALLAGGFAGAILSSVFLMGNSIEDVLDGLGTAMETIIAFVS